MKNSRIGLALLAIGWAACHSSPPPEEEKPATAAPAAPEVETLPLQKPVATEPPQAPAEAPKWDVDHPASPTFEATLDTREGTWMSIDVAPDGREIAFDLLGDLYLLPIEGGEARPLTSGLSWDMQPRFSPDGQSIAFTSDRGGGDNVWVMRRDGSDAHAVTKETFRLLNSPVWTPDGEFLAARKHFTSHRSLGAGEIWLYHKSGGTGLAMTEKQTEQKDLGEPAFSPDGNYLYYSRDITPGPTFEYSRDPYAEIYAIERLDRASGRIERFVSGTGGSIRPTPAPDGKRFAFVRRVRAKTALFVMDLASGAETLVWDGLDRDLQETWAIHGVYPAMAWTSDSRSIVLWAQGKIWRVDVESKSAAEIPFHVRDRRTICEALHQPLDVAPMTFPTRMIRWARVAPDESAVVFQALGHLWIRDLPTGPPRRLTNDGERFEYFPSLSRDGASIVYVAWDDTELGSLYLVPRAGGTPRRLATDPGHFANPAFSPDGATIVYERTAGGRLTNPNWSHETGIFAVPVAGGAERRLTWEGSEPHFGADPTRVYYVVEAGPDQRLLKSIGLQGQEERSHVSSEAATEMRVSPDGRWIAFVERFHAHVAPFPPTGRLVTLGPKADSLPLARVSSGSADFLCWSGDSTRLHWTAGDELFTRELHDAFAFLAGAPAELPKPPEHGVRIGFDAQTDVPDGSYLLEHARLVTMRADEVIEDGAIAIERNRIVAVGHTGDVQAPEGAKRIDLAGRTVIPGLIDVHAHGPQADGGVQPETSWLALCELAFGVTTIHDPSNDTKEIFAASELARAGLVVAPRTFSTGTILYGAAGEYKAEIESLDDARFHLSRMKAVGAFSVKSYNQPRRDQRQMVIAAARELGMEVVPEGGSLFQHNMTQVIDGHTGIEHALPLANVYSDVLQIWGATKVGYTPTLVVAYGGIWGEHYWYTHTRVFENERLNRFVPRDVLDARAVRDTLMAADGDWNHIRAAQVARKLYDVGVEVHIGAHGQREGLAAHWELWMLGQGGLSPHQALRCGTLYGARYIGAEKDLGSLEPGKLADLLVLDEDPLEDLSKSESIALTMLNGRLYDAHTMDEIGNHPRPRARGWWER
jgi:imidazolonepropionase-like amidohydrolase/Tol biopolymer transport system component